MTREEIESLMASFTLKLRSDGRSKQTIKTYTDSINSFLRWSDATGMPPNLDKTTVRTFVADLLDAGQSQQTALLRLTGVKLLSSFAEKEGEIDRDELLGMKPPKVDEKVLMPLQSDELGALVGTCQSKSFCDRRDEAIIRVLTETAIRSEELVLMTVRGTNLRNLQVIIARGKGGVGRPVPISPQAARALDRYLRVRRTHRLAPTDTLWLGDRGKPFQYAGLYAMVKRRAKQAGIERNLHPHLFRHTGASRWLAAGGSEGGLMAVGGWKTRKMMARYTKAQEQSRAAEEFERLNLGVL